MRFFGRAHLFLTVGLSFLLASCLTGISAEPGEGRLDGEYAYELMPSAYGFRDSIESVLSRKIDLENAGVGSFSLSADDIRNAAYGSRSQEIVSITESDSGTQFDFQINVDNYKALEEIFPELGDDRIKTYLADYNRDMDEEEYLEMIDFVFGEDAVRDLRASFASVRLTCQRGFASFQGLERVGENELALRIRLLDFLLLKTPINFSFKTNPF